jgi:DNA-directed RNA polymerase beta subunit
LNINDANKGVISKIIPDELAPIHEETGERIDILLSPLAVFSRMNLGQVIDTTISKAIKYCEKEILDNPETIPIMLDKLIKLSNCIGNTKYSKEIEELKQNIINDKNIRDSFIISIEKGGLYFECPSFCNFKYKELSDLIETEFNIKSADAIRIKKETFEYVKKEIGVDLPVPDEDIIYPNIFNGPSYTLKLKQLSDSKTTSRDLGAVSNSTKQPIKDKTGLGNSASRLGGMEFDGLLAHNVLAAIRELRSVKSDSYELKTDLINQILQTGVYNLPKHQSKGYTKQIIDALIIFLNN